MKILHISHNTQFAKRFVVPIVNFLTNENHEVDLVIPQPISRVAAVIMKCDISLNPFIFIKRLISLWIFYRKKRYDVIHAHTSRGALLPLLAGFLAQCPHRIYHNHGFPYLGHKAPLRLLLIILEKLNFTLATNILTVSKDMADEVTKTGFSHKKAIVLGQGSACGLDFFEFSVLDRHARRQAKEKWGGQEAGLVFGYVGRPVQRKGFHLLLEGWKKARVYEHGAILLIAGCEENDAKNIDIAPGIKFLGQIDDMRAFYAATDCVLLPSFHEGFGYALAEASACQNIAVASDIPGPRIIIEPEKTGFFLSEVSSEGVKEALLKVSSLSVKERDKMGKNGRQRMEKYFRREAVLAELANFYAINSQQQVAPP